MNGAVEINPLAGTVARFMATGNNTLVSRAIGFSNWKHARVRAGVWPFARVLQEFPHSTTAIEDDAGTPAAGLNFASQDYLSLAGHPSVLDATIEALRTFGSHSAGSALLLGNTRLSRDLQEVLMEFLDMPHVSLFPTGWAAGVGVITHSRDRRTTCCSMHEPAHEVL